ncbi:uncharacterized protein L199_000386 [Kwoniella botswanensis]|uniref:uncharacterized protein n=1 Tax=Kwoniella botswanensis TaxID=1268659 RepID=UPI00315C9A30
MSNQTPDWLASVTHVELVVDKQNFDQVANHYLNWEGTLLSRHPRPAFAHPHKFPFVARIALGNNKLAMQAVKNDHEFFTEHLLDLQGTVIPTHYGTYIEPETEVACMIFEDVGTPVGQNHCFRIH